MALHQTPLYFLISSELWQGVGKFDAYGFTIRTAPGSDAWSGLCQMLFYDAKPKKRLADGCLLLRLHLLDVASLGIAGVCDESVLPLGLRYVGAVDVEAVPLLYPRPNHFVGRLFCFRIQFTLIVICVDYEGEPGAVHRQTGFGYGVRIPFDWNRSTL